MLSKLHRVDKLEEEELTQEPMRTTLALEGDSFGLHKPQLCKLWSVTDRLTEWSGKRQHREQELLTKVHKCYLYISTE